ncbi:DUF998 domain-containing protein [Microbacterium abyssi]|uniref:DUF998 domain-containing protein n=1 Tax=Microbacterium abyssi TaxID=2782166 RepID=UPI001E41C1A8|nr:DUF998 domain-containing protein [Microbacterium sp. A18JL241]
MDTEQRMARETRAIWATVICFVAGALAGSVLLWGNPRPVAGDGSVGIPVAVVAGVLAAASFVVSTQLHRRGEHASMPRWQVIISSLSAVALTIAFAGVTALGVLLATEVLGVGLQGLELPPIGGGLVTGVAAAVAGRLTFEAGIGLRTSDLANLLFGYLIIGTLFAMLTAADPRWWERNFSQLGIGAGAWAFNGTLVVAGILIATVGSYIGRDLHRIRGDVALGRLAWVVALWAATGLALAGVGLLSLERIIILHNIAALATLVLFVAAGILTTIVMPGPPRALLLTSAGIALLIVVAVLLAFVFDLYPVTALEAIVIGLGLLWLTTLVRILAVFTPVGTRPSVRRSLLRG